MTAMASSQLSCLQALLARQAASRCERYETSQAAGLLQCPPHTPSALLEERWELKPHSPGGAGRSRKGQPPAFSSLTPSAESEVGRGLPPGLISLQHCNLDIGTFLLLAPPGM